MHCTLSKMFSYRYIEDEGDGSIEAIPCTFPIPPEIELFDYEIVRQYIRDQYYEEPNQASKSRISIQRKKDGGSKGWGGLHSAPLGLGKKRIR